MVNKMAISFSRRSQIERSLLSGYDR